MKPLAFGIPTVPEIVSLLSGDYAMYVINARYIKHWAYLPVGSVKYPGMLYT